MAEQDFFTTAEAAEFLRYKPATLAIWRSQAKGPAYIKGRGIFVTTFQIWLSGRLAASRYSGGSKIPPNVISPNAMSQSVKGGGRLLRSVPTD